MKTLISRLTIAAILSITLAAMIAVSSSIAKKAGSSKTSAMVCSPSGQEMLNGSFSNLINTLNATSVR